MLELDRVPHAVRKQTDKVELEGEDKKRQVDEEGDDAREAAPACAHYIGGVDGADEGQAAGAHERCDLEHVVEPLAVRAHVDAHEEDAPQAEEKSDAQPEIAAGKGHGEHEDDDALEKVHRVVEERQWLELLIESKINKYFSFQ